MQVLCLITNLLQTYYHSAQLSEAERPDVKVNYINNTYAFFNSGLLAGNTISIFNSAE